ncbi:MAG TPA: hypothetical protein VF600_17010 [Abditibacteriaceae bacterium]
MLQLPVIGSKVKAGRALHDEKASAPSSVRGTASRQAPLSDA